MKNFNLNPKKNKYWNKLYKHFLYIKNNININNLFKNDKNRCDNFSKIINNLMFVDISKNLITNKTLKLLILFAKESKIEIFIKNLFNGNLINKNNNKILFPMLRLSSSNSFNYDNNSVQNDILKSLNKIKNFCNNLNTKWLGYSNKKITDIVHIGIGGSYLGPKIVIESLKNYIINNLKIHFVSNIHGENLTDILNKVDHSTTLFIISSKSFKTEETIVNAYSARNWFLNKTENNYNLLNNHFIILSSNEDSYKLFKISNNNFFKIFDWVNGRFSIWSAAGLTISILIGYKNFKRFLNGANIMDNHFKNTKLEDNIPVLLSLISIWYNNFFKFESENITAYNNNMYNFYLYYQQLSMESNGKNISLDNEIINNYDTGQISFGGIGTNSQHSYFQLLHQGTKTIPSDFILFSKFSKNDFFKENYNILSSNCISQSMSLSFGNYKKENNKNKICLGNKPNNFILFKEDLNPENLGALISMYEHKIIVQGILLNICSFDQWGVELGKQISNEIIFDIKNDEFVNSYDSSTNKIINLYKKWRNI